ncbi:MAG TPA: S53 family peptidase, partial [Terriglobales bacterium]|nr:S53 family peptidase [Terriglobales bacterium]
MPINKRFCFAGLTLAVALGALTVVPFGRGAAAVQDRIPDGIDNTHRVALHGQVHRLARPEFDQGSLPGSTLLEHMTLVFARSAAQQQALDALLQAQQDRTSPQYHQWLSPEQFGERFGMSDSDLAKVKTWLQQQGFTVTEVARSRDSVTFRGTVAQVNAAFATSIDRYKVNGETHFANASEPLLPSALAQVTLTLRGLHDFRPRPQVVRPKYTSYISGNHFITPDDFATIYDLKPLYNMTPSAIDGTGQTIAVMGQTDILLNDLSTFRQNSGLPPNAPQACSGCNNSTFAIPGPDPGVQQGDLTEADLDLEWAGAVAPKANIIYVNAGTQGGAFDALQYAVNNNVAPVISVSYGTCETQDIGPATTGGTVAWLDNLAQKANAQGITIVGPAGDSGAADCDAGVANPSGSPNQNTIPATQGLSIDVPGASPSVTSVGGTQFNASSNNSSFWNAGNNSLNGSALGYIPEVAWNETQSQGGFSESGGGFSTVFAKPAYQQSFTSAGGIGMPGGNARYAPDIAMLAGAGPNEGGLLTCTNGSCANGFRDSNQNLSPVGGTSAGVPTFAAMVVLLNQMSGAHFDSVHNTWVNSQGNINPALYSLATRTSDQAFHDITSGNNQVPCTPGSPNSKNTALNCPPSGTFGYSAGVGYDQVTGLGSVDAFKVVYELANNANSAPAPAGDFSINGQPSTLPVTRGGSAANFQATFNVSGSFTSPINVS